MYRLATLVMTVPALLVQARAQAVAVATLTAMRAVFVVSIVAVRRARRGKWLPLPAPLQGGCEAREASLCPPVAPQRQAATEGHEPVEASMVSAWRLLRHLRRHWLRLP